MQPYPQPNGPSNNDRNEGRGPLSRTWPQLFKKRRRYSPVRESAQQQLQQQQQVQQVQHLQQMQTQPPQIQPQQQPVQLPIHPIRPLKSPSVTTQSITSPTVSSIRSPSIATDNARAGGVTTPQADLLASKSNYELISSGQHLEMGLHFSTAMATGVMMKRATHRAAEQARRDRMKNAMVDLAEFLLDGEVTFGSGTTCFVVMRGKDGADGSEKTSTDDASNGKSGKGVPPGDSVPGEKKTVNKARLIEMALEKMKAQEKEIEMLRKEIEDLRTEDKMDVS
ncbi:unnamed protein product [Alternaria alternata]